MKQLIWVFIGGGLGSMLRYGLAIWLHAFGNRFPVGTLTANVLACIILGVALGLSDQSRIHESTRLMIATGFCGGLSTFSTFTADTQQLQSSAGLLMAVFNIVLNVALCLLAYVLGRYLVVC
jgi:fluoride exporter